MESENKKKGKKEAVAAANSFMRWVVFYRPNRARNLVNEDTKKKKKKTCLGHEA